MSEEADKEQPQEETKPSLEAIIAAQAEQIAELQRFVAQQAEEVKATGAKAAEAARAAFVEKINGGLVDDSVWALVPQVDAATEDGRKELRDWAAKHPSLFRGVTAPGSAPAPKSGGFRSFADIVKGMGK